MGLIALVGDHLHWAQPKIFNMHLLFGVILAATVARSLQIAWHSGLDAVQYHLHTRRLARWVYLLLYVLAAVRLGLAAIAGNTNADHLDHLRHLARDDSLSDFQVYIGYAFVAILVIRMCSGYRLSGGTVQEQGRLGSCVPDAKTLQDCLQGQQFEAKSTSKAGGEVGAVAAGPRQLLTCYGQPENELLVLQEDSRDRVEQSPRLAHGVDGG